MSQQGTRRGFQSRRGGKFEVLRFWFKRVGILVIASVAVLWLGAWFFLSGAAGRTGDWAQQKIIASSAGMGFRVENLLVEGRVHADPQVILAIVNTEKGEPLFGFDPEAARAQLEKISWVKTARVERRLPDTIYVRLEERVPLALWRHDGKLSLIDAEGQVLSDSNLAPFRHFAMVSGGEQAAKGAASLLALLAAETDIAKRVESAQWVGDRRWDLTLDNGILVRLPEGDIGLALKRLAAAAREDGLLEKAIAEVDLHEPDRLVVRTRPGNVQEYKASLSADGNDI